MGRAPCCSTDAGLNRGAWTAEEDSILNKYILSHGDNCGWKYLSQKAGLRRCGKSCRLRWLNYLRPDIKRGNISADEEDLIIRMHKLLGNRWSLIAGRLPGRTDNEIKNYWNTKLVRKIESKEYCVPTAKEICTTSKYQSDCSEEHQVLRTAAIRTTAVRLPKNPYKENANIISGHREIKLQREKSWCSQSFVDDQIKGSDLDQIVDYSSAQNTIEWENHGIEIIGKDFPTFWSSLIANQFSDCDPNDREDEFNTCNSSLDLNEMCLPEDNFPWSPYNFLTEEWINESQYLQKI